ncbi:hypothetical protein ACFL6O_02950 [candidate division KSB1 bacterium]
MKIYKLAVCLILLIILSPDNPLSAQESISSLVSKVQQNSRKAYESIESVSFRAHSKMYIYLGVKLFDLKLVPIYEEYYVDGFWMKPDSIRYNVIAYRRAQQGEENVRVESDSLESIGQEIPLPNPFTYDYDPSVFSWRENEGAIHQRMWPVYPFAPGADSLYNYTKVSEVVVNGKGVIEIKVEPKFSDIPGVVGTYQIDREEYDVVGSDVIFNDAATFKRTRFRREEGEGKLGFSLNVSGYDNHRVITEKNLYYMVYWLPSKIEEEFDLQIYGLNGLVFREVEIEEYEINPADLKPGLSENQKIVYNSEPEFEANIRPEDNRDKLTDEELAEIIDDAEDDFSGREMFGSLFDNEYLAKEAVKLGLEQKSRDYLDLAGNPGDYFHYNRVEGVSLNYGLNFSNVGFDNYLVSFNGGYGIADEKWKGDISFVKFLDNKNRFFLEGNVYRNIGYEEDPAMFSTNKNTLSSLFFKTDYRDYFYKEGTNIGIGYRITDNAGLKLMYVSHREENALRNAKFSVFSNSEIFRANPEIDEGEFRGLKGSIVLNRNNLDAGIHFEYTDKNTFNSDFDHSLVKADILYSKDTSKNTAIKLHLGGQASDGTLSPQRWYDFGGKSVMNYYGRLRGIGYKYFTGSSALEGTAEFIVNAEWFFQKGDIPGLLRPIKFTFWGGFGWSELQDEAKLSALSRGIPCFTADEVYYEQGFSIGDRLNFMRIDFISTNIPGNKVLININFIR